MKKNRMSISCEVEDEIQFKALCDILNGEKSNLTINGKHSSTLVTLMREYYKKNLKCLSDSQKSNLVELKNKYRSNKNNNGIF